MNSKNTILFFCMIFVASAAFCQTKYIAINGKTVFETAKMVDFQNSILSQNTTNIAKQNKMLQVSPSMLVSPTFYVNNLGFFCVQEIKLQKITKIPFKFRLGSVQYVDYLEGKKGTGLYGR